MIPHTKETGAAYQVKIQIKTLFLFPMTEVLVIHNGVSQPTPLLAIELHGLHFCLALNSVLSAFLHFSPSIFPLYLHHYQHFSCYLTC